MEENNYGFENLKKMHYIDLIQKETSRYFGPASSIFPREVKNDVYLKDVPLIKDTIIMPRFNRNTYS